MTVSPVNRVVTYLYRVVKHERKTLITRPLLESGMRTFGSWIQNLDWHQVLETSGTQNKADAFLRHSLSRHEHMLSRKKKKRVHSNDKSWINPHVKNLIAKRQTAFISGNNPEWRKLRNEVKLKLRRQKQSIMLPEYKAYKIQNPENGTNKLRKSPTPTGLSSG